MEILKGIFCIDRLKKVSSRFKRQRARDQILVQVPHENRRIMPKAFNGLAVWMGAALCMGCIIMPPHAAQSISEQVRESIRNRIETAGTDQIIIVRNDLIHSSTILPRFYEDRAFWPAWSDDSGASLQAHRLINTIYNAGQDGLDPNDYHLGKIEETLFEIIHNHKKGNAFDPQVMTDFDLLLTDSFLVLGSHLLAGRTNPESFDSQWQGNRREVNMAEILQEALDYGSIEESLRDLAPQYPGYKRLSEALVLYKEIFNRGGWPFVPSGPKMEKGLIDERVVALRERLAASGDLDKHETESPEIFNDELDQALKRFQHRHGLIEDGIVGKETLDALNIPAGGRMRQIELNMERWRWLPHDLGGRYLVVNIADFHAEVFEGGQSVMPMKVVVGKDYRQTPVFSSKITYMVLNPYWNIPDKIAIEDIVPKILKDPGYLVKEHIKVFRGWNNGTKEIAPQTIDWGKVSPKNFRYRMRQDPGTGNPLGRIKFMFANKFGVYLHDTPSQALFERLPRTFSSGCIRIQKPIELAEYLLKGDPAWTHEKLMAAIKKKAERTISIPKPLPIHLLYWTAWVDEDGTVHFRKDIYGRDQPLDQAFSQEPPQP